MCWDGHSDRWGQGVISAETQSARSWKSRYRLRRRLPPSVRAPGVRIDSDQAAIPGDSEVFFTRSALMIDVVVTAAIGQVY